MPLAPDLLEILVCPETKQSLEPANATLLERLNAEIRAGKLYNRGGDAVTREISEALVRADGRALYVIDDGIPVMLIEESIELAG